MELVTKNTLFKNSFKNIKSVLDLNTSSVPVVEKYSNNENIPLISLGMKTDIIKSDMGQEHVYLLTAEIYITAKGYNNAGDLTQEILSLMDSNKNIFSSNNMEFNDVKQIPLYIDNSKSKSKVYGNLLVYEYTINTRIWIKLIQ